MPILTDLGRRNLYYWSEYRYRRAYIADLLRLEAPLGEAQIVGCVEEEFGVHARTAGRDLEALLWEGHVRRIPLAEMVDCRTVAEDRRGVPHFEVTPPSPSPLQTLTVYIMAALRQAALRHGPIGGGDLLPDVTPQEARLARKDTS